MGFHWWLACVEHDGVLWLSTIGGGGGEATEEPLIPRKSRGNSISLQMIVSFAHLSITQIIWQVAFILFSVHFFDL
jgi:hypothetical protein